MASQNLGLNQPLGICKYIYMCVCVYVRVYLYIYIFIIYIYIISAAYIEYRIDNFGLKKHLPKSKKTILRIFLLSISAGFHTYLTTWKHRYSYGICFGSVCALQNFTPNISTPNILSIFSAHTRGVEIRYILSRQPGSYICRHILDIIYLYNILYERI